MTTMYDSTDSSALPDNTELCAGYINGRYQSYYGMVQRFGASKVLSITIKAHNPDGSYVIADILDIESGDATPSEAPGWLSANPNKTLYCSRLGTWPATIKLCPDAQYWIADYTGTPHLVPGSVCTQWTDAGPYDISLTDGTWPLSIPIHPPINPINPPIQVGDYVLNTVAVTTDQNGNGWLPTNLPWSSFVAATIQGSDPNSVANGGDGVYWPGYAKVQNRNGMILVSVVGSLPLSTINVFVATS